MEKLNLQQTKLTKTSKEVVRVAVSKGIEFNKLENNRVELKWGKKSYKFRALVCSSFNSRLAKRLTNQKELTSRYLRSRGFNSPENAVFYKDDLERAWNWAEPILPVVIKPYNSTLGNAVTVGIQTKSDFKKAFNKVCEKYDSALVEKMENGVEYRFTFLEGEIVAITKRVKAHVIGDGKLSIEQLIEQKNHIREQRKNPIHKSIKINKVLRNILIEQGFDLNSIPNKGEKVHLSKKMNVVNGAEALDYTDKIPDSIKRKVAKAASSIPGLKIAGMDVLVNKDDAIIIEINADPNLLMHEYPWEGKSRNVISKMLDKMFNID